MPPRRRDDEPPPEPVEDGGAPDDDDKKERVLHTRVPAVLEKELKRLATNLRVPVSNVVRTILEDAVAAVDRVGHRAEGELRGAADRLARMRHPRAPANEHEDDPVTQPGRPSARRRVEEESDAEPRPILAGVLGWQPLLLASDGACTLCGKDLPAGSDAFLGVRDGVGPRVLLGPECLPSGRRPKEPPGT